jgi:uncharacterized OB-fold protein
MTDEKKVSPKQWVGDMEADYIYPTGIAGDKFFKELKKSGQLVASECGKCGTTYVPPRMYCENCFVEIETWKTLPPEGTVTTKTLPPEGTVTTFTVASLNEKNEKLPEPRVWAHIKIGDGGLVHNLGEIEPGKVSIGMKVEAVLKPADNRKGEISDILYFKPK